MYKWVFWVTIQDLWKIIAILDLICDLRTKCIEVTIDSWVGTKHANTRGGSGFAWVFVLGLAAFGVVGYIFYKYRIRVCIISFFTCINILFFPPPFRVFKPHFFVHGFIINDFFQFIFDFWNNRGFLLYKYHSRHIVMIKTTKDTRCESVVGPSGT